MATFRLEAINDLIAAIYGAAVAPHDFSNVLDLVADSLGGKGLMIGPLVRGASPDPRLFAYASTVFHENIPDYLNHYVGLNPRKNWLTDNNIQNAVFTDLDFIDKRRIDRDEFYNDFLLKNGNFHSLDRVSTGIVNDSPIWISVQYSRQASAPDDDQKQVFSILSQHLVRALDIQRHMMTSASADGTLIGLVESYSIPALLLDGTGQILHLNKGAERLEGRGLVYRNRFIGAASTRDTALINQLIASTLKYRPPMPLPPPVAIARPGHQLPLLLKSVPLEGSRSHHPLADLFAQQRRVLVIATCPVQDNPNNLALAFQKLGLTIAEARLADLVGNGLTPEEAAARAQISLHTARLHLRRIYDKLGIHRQADLVRIAANLRPFGD